jgi:hypothetical protein
LFCAIFFGDRSKISGFSCVDNNNYLKNIKHMSEISRSKTPKVALADLNKPNPRLSTLGAYQKTDAAKPQFVRAFSTGETVQSRNGRVYGVAENGAFVRLTTKSTKHSRKAVKG